MSMGSRLGEELVRLRQVKGAGVSQREVERQTGISKQYLSQLERGIATKPAPDRRSCFFNPQTRHQRV
jgi:transcriptional regulator with XRE-family HTH domain